jgi:hypothetical protein
MPNFLQWLKQTEGQLLLLAATALIAPFVNGAMVWLGENQQLPLTTLASWAVFAGMAYFANWRMRAWSHDYWKVALAAAWLGLLCLACSSVFLLLATAGALRLVNPITSLANGLWWAGCICQAFVLWKIIGCFLNASDGPSLFTVVTGRGGC